MSIVHILLLVMSLMIMEALYKLIIMMDSHDGFIFVVTDVIDKVTSLVVYHTQCNLTIYHLT